MGTFRSLRHRNYRLYFFGQLVSLVGSWMQSTTLMWLAYELTHQSKWPAFLMVAQIGPTVLLGPWAGLLADRWHKQALILRTQTAFLATAVALAALYFLGWLDAWLMLAVMGAQGIVQAIDLPSRLAFVPELVARDDLINAVALNSVLFNVARALGPAVAGLLLVWAGPGVCFLLNAVSYLAVLAALRAMKLPPGADEPSGHPEKRSVWGGFVVLRRSPRLGALVLMAGGLALAGWPVLALLPAFAARVLNLAERGYSITLSAVGLGALLAALSAATFGTVERRRRFLAGGLCLAAAALFGLAALPEWVPAAGCAVGGAVSALPAAETSLPVLAAAFCCGVFGFGMILFFATGQAALQLGIDDRSRGRVMGVWAMMLSGGAPLGNLLFGPAADVWGVTAVLQAQAIAAAGLAGALLVTLAARRQGEKV